MVKSVSGGSKKPGIKNDVLQLERKKQQKIEVFPITPLVLAITPTITAETVALAVIDKQNL